MMNIKSKKGTTLVELIISLALISVILVFMIKMISDMNNSIKNRDYASKNQVVRAEIIRTIEMNLIENKVNDISFFGNIVTIRCNNNNIYIIEINGKKVEYKNNGSIIRAWNLEEGTIGTISVNKYSEGEIKRGVISIEIYTGNDNNKSGNNNPIDDITIPFMLGS